MVFGNARLDFADEIRTDVRGLRVNPSPNAGEQRDRRRPEGKTGEHRHQLGHVQLSRRAENPRIVDEEDAESEKTEADHTHAHDRTSVEGNAQGLIEAGARSVGRAHIGFGGDTHADVSGESRTDRTNDKRKRDQRTGLDFRSSLPSQKRRDDHDETGKNTVFGAQEGHGAFGDETADALHLLVAGRLAGDPARAEEGEKKGQHTGGREEIDQLIHTGIVRG